MLEHKCKKCNNIKPIERFKKDLRLKLGHRNICKDCDASRFMKWKRDSGFLNYQKQHYQENKDSIRAQQREYFQKNKKLLNKKITFIFQFL